MTSFSQNTEHFEHFEVETFCINIHCEESRKSIFARVPDFSETLCLQQFCQMTKSCPMSNQSMTWTVVLL